MGISLDGKFTINPSEAPLSINEERNTGDTEEQSIYPLTPKGGYLLHTSRFAHAPEQLGAFWQTVCVWWRGHLRAESRRKWRSWWTVLFDCNCMQPAATATEEAKKMD